MPWMLMLGLQHCLLSAAAANSHRHAINICMQGSERTEGPERDTQSQFPAEHDAWRLKPFESARN